MTRTSSANVCPDCRAPIPAGLPFVQCPACLIRLGLEAGTVEQRKGGAIEFLPIEVLQTWFHDIEIIRVLGVGGAGAVYLARQPKLDRLIALKVMMNEHSDDPFAADRFLQEARLLARLEHPRIVDVFEIREHNDHICLFMEYLEGGNLRHRLRREPLPPTDALRMAEQICQGLEHAHEQGIIHRDIKPENLVLDGDGNIKIADFGIAKLLDSENSRSLILTRSGQLMGSANYIAPEQYEGKTVIDRRVDLYALGVVLYEMLTGIRPAVDYQPPSRVQPLDPRFDAIVSKLLKRRPEERYATAGEVTRDLASLANAPPFFRLGFLPRALAFLLLAVSLVVVGGFAWKVNTRSGDDLMAIYGTLAQSYVDFKNPSATCERKDDDFSLGGVVDGIRHIGAWSTGSHSNSPQALVTQTPVPVNAEQILFQIVNDGGGFPGHKPKRFKLSVTADPNPTVSDTSIRWTPIHPRQVITSNPDSNALVEADGETIRVTGSRAVPDDYSVLAIGEFKQIRGVRLDLLTDPETGKLGFGGPAGWDVHVSEFEILVYPPPTTPIADWVSLPIARGMVSQIGGQINSGAKALFDGNERGIGYWDTGRHHEKVEAILCLQKPVVSDQFQFHIMHNSGEYFKKCQRFRFSVTTDADPTRSDATWMPLHARQVNFEPAGPEAKVNDDDSVSVLHGKEAEQCNYIVHTAGSSQTITGFRLELFADAKGNIGLPGGTGHAFVSEWKIFVPNRSR